MQETWVGSIWYSDNSEEVKGRYGRLARTRHGSSVKRRLPFKRCSRTCAQIGSRDARSVGQKALVKKATWRRALIPSSVR